MKFCGAYDFAKILMYRNDIQPKYGLNIFLHSLQILTEATSYTI